MDQSEENSQPKPLGLSVAAAAVIGKRLAEARENRRMSVAELSRKVKIREHFVTAIERGDWSSLPPGLNGRGLVRLYARELGVGVPELEPSAHLTAVNAKFERAEQQSAEEVLRAQTIRSYPAGEAPAPVSSRASSPSPSSGSASRSDRSSRRDPAPRSGSESSRGRESVRGSIATPPIPKAPTPSARFISGPSDGQEDESPLDVLTPDIAAVLGLDLDSQPQQSSSSGARNASESSARDRSPAPREAIPSVSVDDILGTSVDERRETLETLIPEVNLEDVLPPQDVSVTRDQSPPVAETFVSAAVPSTLPIPQSPYGDEPQSALASYVDQIARTHPESQVRGESLAEGLLSQAPVATELGIESQPRQRRNMGMRLALVGAVVVAIAGIGIGISFLPGKTPEPALEIKELPEEAGSQPPSESGAEGQEPESSSVTMTETKTGAEASGAEASSASTAADTSAPVSATASGAPSSETPQTSLQPLDAKGAPPPVASEAPPAPAASSAPTEPAQGQAPDLDPQAASPSAATPAAASAATPAAASQEGSAAARSVGSGASLAKLMIREPVEVQIRVDDAVVLEGQQPAGPLQILFSKKAELVVQDGSKIDLTYGEWEHGPLGQKGRKRRIILHGSRFQPEGAPPASR